MARSIFTAALLAAFTTFGCNLTSEKPGDAPSSPSGAAPAPAAAPGQEAPKQANPAATGNAAETKKPDGAKVDEKPAVLPAQPPRQSKALTPECAQLHKRIQDLDAAIPQFFRGVKRSGDEIYKDIVACRDLSKRFLSECAGTEESCEVSGILARVSLAGHKRYKEQLAQEGVQEPDLSDMYKDFMDETKKVAESAARDCAPGSKGRAMALRVLMEFADMEGRYSALRENANSILRENPSISTRPSLLISIAQSLIYERKYAEALKFLREVISKHFDDVEYVVYNEKLLDALTGTGDSEGIEELMHLIQVEYPSRLPKVPPESDLRDQYVLWLCTSGFWLGFARMCGGDMEGARKYFKEQVAAAEAQKLAPGEKAGNNICNIFANLRSYDMIYWIDNHYGKPPQTEVDLEEMWATPKGMTLKETKGKVVAILGRLPDNRRAESFLQRLDELAGQHAKDGLVVIELGFLGGTRTAASDTEMLEKMRADAKKLNLKAVYAGYDPDNVDRKVFQALHLTVGTASFIVLDRNGLPAWYIVDPRDMDKELAARVIERLLKSPPANEEKK